MLGEGWWLRASGIPDGSYIAVVVGGG